MSTLTRKNLVPVVQNVPDVPVVEDLAEVIILPDSGTKPAGRARVFTFRRAARHALGCFFRRLLKVFPPYAGRLDAVYVR